MSIRHTVGGAQKLVTRAPVEHAEHAGRVERA